MAKAKLPSPPAHRAKDFRATVIGLAYGTFDLLHDGHRHLLRQARVQCDTLIVAVDSDRYARERKGWGRPVEDEAQRSYSVVATSLVDLVIAVDNDDQLRQAIRYYQPNVIFFGKTPERDAILSGNTAERVGTFVPDKVVLVPLLPGHSTTAKIKARLQ